jgi:hypothetical protein
VLERRLELSPIRMSFIPESRVRAVLVEAGGVVIDADRDVDGPFSNVTYWVTRSHAGDRPIDREMGVG